MTPNDAEDSALVSRCVGRLKSRDAALSGPLAGQLLHALDGVAAAFKLRLYFTTKEGREEASSSTLLRAGTSLRRGGALAGRRPHDGFTPPLRTRREGGWRERQILGHCQGLR